MGPNRSYTVFKNNGENIAGGVSLQTTQLEEVGPHWMPYFAVDDVDARVDKAVALGGTVLAPPTDIPGEGRIAVLRDPAGAVFSFFKPDEESQ